MRHRGPVSVILAMRHVKFNLQMPQIELHHPSLVSRPLACDLHVRPCRGFTGLAQLGPRRVPWTRHLRHRGPTDLARQAAGLALGPANGSSTPWRNVPSHPRHRIIGSISSANPWSGLHHPPSATPWSTTRRAASAPNRSTFSDRSRSVQGEELSLVHSNRLHAGLVTSICVVNIRPRVGAEGPRGKLDRST